MRACRRWLRGSGRRTTRLHPQAMRVPYRPARDRARSVQDDRYGPSFFYHIVGEPVGWAGRPWEVLGELRADPCDGLRKPFAEIPLLEMSRHRICDRCPRAILHPRVNPLVSDDLERLLRDEKQDEHSGPAPRLVHVELVEFSQRKLVERQRPFLPVTRMADDDSYLSGCRGLGFRDFFGKDS